MEAFNASFKIFTEMEVPYDEWKKKVSSLNRPIACAFRILCTPTSRQVPEGRRVAAFVSVAFDNEPAVSSAAAVHGHDDDCWGQRKNARS